MNFFKNILGRIYAVYGLLLFIITMLIVFLPMWIISRLPDPKKTRYFLNIGRVWMHIYMPLIFCPVRRKGLKYFAPGQTYVVVCNHNSLVDVPVTTPGVPGVNKTLAKKEMGKIPVFGVLYNIGGLMVDRSSEASRKQSFEDMKDIIRKGMHMILFPEGTRNRTGQPLKEFYDGAFSLAIDMQVPVMPSVLLHTKDILPAGKKFYAMPHVIDYHFLPPVPTTGMTRDDLPALKEQIFRTMWDYIVQHDPAFQKTA